MMKPMVLDTTQPPEAVYSKIQRGVLLAEIYLASARCVQSEYWKKRGDPLQVNTISADGLEPVSLHRHGSVDDICPAGVYPYHEIWFIQSGILEAEFCDLDGSVLLGNQILRAGDCVINYSGSVHCIRKATKCKFIEIKTTQHDYKTIRMNI